MILYSYTLSVTHLLYSDGAVLPETMHLSGLQSHLQLYAWPTTAHTQEASNNHWPVLHTFLWAENMRLEVHHNYNVYFNFKSSLGGHIDLTK